MFFVSLVAASALAKSYYIAPDGSDSSGNGSVSSPYATLMKAHQYVLAGDTVFMRGGTYKITESQIYLKSGIWAYINYLDKSGSSASKRIYYWAYPGEKPVIDMSAVKPAGYRNIVFYVKGSWLHFKGLEITGTQVTITDHTQSECFRNEGGSNNIYEQCVMRDGMAIGFYLTKGANNLVLNCDAFNNWDSVSESGRGGNVDGFGFHGNKGSTGNVIRGCRAWLNSDDGYDCINNAENVTFDNCWAFYNGYSAGFVSRGDGNGFKIGGYGQAPSVASLPNPIPAYTVKFCMAYRNKANGFYANHHVETGSNWFNNSAYRNSTNFNMLSQKITKSTKTGNDTTLDCPGLRHVLKNNLSFKYSSQRDTLNLGSSVNVYNSFSPGISVLVNSSDFVNVSEPELITSRNADGSLPDIGFMKLIATSDLIDKGQNLGFAYSGAAPDLGAFEYQQQTPVDVLPVKSLLIYPDPVSDILNFTGSADKNIEIFNCEGKRMLNLNVTYSVDVSYLPSGIYIIRIKTENEKPLVSRFIKK